MRDAFLKPLSLDSLSVYSDFSAPSIGYADLAQKNEYVVFSMDYFGQMIDMIRGNVGSIFSIALYSFLVLMGVHLVFFIIDHFGG